MFDENGMLLPDLIFAGQEAVNKAQAVIGERPSSDARIIEITDGDGLVLEALSFCDIVGRSGKLI